MQWQGLLAGVFRELKEGMMKSTCHIPWQIAGIDGDGAVNVLPLARRLSAKDTKEGISNKGGK